MTETVAATPLRWDTSGNETFAFSGMHDDGSPFFYAFVPHGAGWKNRSDSELRDVDPVDHFDTLEAAKAWAERVEAKAAADFDNNDPED